MTLKSSLYQAIAPVKRGLQASPQQITAIFAAVVRLEEQNPHPQPNQVPDLLSGDWQLLFTTSQGLLGFDRIPTVKLGQIYQCIRADQSRIYNVAELESLGILKGLVSVTARFEVVSPQRLKVNFDRAIAGLQPLLGYRDVEQFIQVINSDKRLAGLDLKIGDREQRGWLETTYLDQDLRIGRGNAGSLFILQRQRSLSF
ncbi:MAG: PAP/fibrillin family protein [Pseudanabaenaceae cyanobacterium bins.68]|nr:PAP/fibrillin family protein [Pseudanabaenaceae cyanobacterium bins.68]